MTEISSLNLCNNNGRRRFYLTRQGAVMMGESMRPEIRVTSGSAFSISPFSDAHYWRTMVIT